MLLNMMVERKKLGLRQQDLADLTHIQVKRLAKIERGQLSASVFEAMRISHILKKPIETIFVVESIPSAKS